MDENEKEDVKSYEDTLDADVAAAFKEVSEKAAAPASDEKTSEKPAEAVASDAKPEKAEPEKAEKAEKEDAGQRRDEHGRFKAKDEKAQEKAAGEPEKAAQRREQPAKGEQAEPEKAAAVPATGGPPPSWSIKAKAQWDGLPAEVRAEIAKRETEVGQGLAGLRDFKELKPFADMATQRGTSLPRVLDHYVKNVEPVERAFAENPGLGVALLLQNRGYSKEQAVQLFRDLAERYGGKQSQSNGVPAATNGANGQPNELDRMFGPILAPIMTEVKSLRAEMSNRVAADQKAAEAVENKTIRDAWDTFAAKPENRFANDVRADVIWLLDSGKVPNSADWMANFKTAYDMACRMHPEIHEALIEQRLAGDREAQRKKEQEAAEKAKAASRSVTGTRMPGTTFKQKDRPKGGSYEDSLDADVRAAYAAHAS